MNCPTIEGPYQFSFYPLLELTLWYLFSSLKAAFVWIRNLTLFIRSKWQACSGKSKNTPKLWILTEAKSGNLRVIINVHFTLYTSVLLWKIMHILGSEVIKKKNENHCWGYWNDILSLQFHLGTCKTYFLVYFVCTAHSHWVHCVYCVFFFF